MKFETYISLLTYYSFERKTEKTWWLYAKKTSKTWHYLKQNFGIYSTINFTWNFPPFLPVFASNGNGIYTHTSSSTHMFMYCKNDSSFPDLMHCLESYPSLLTQYYYVWRKTFVKWKNFWEDSLCSSTLSFPNRETSAMYCTYYYYALYLDRMNKKQDR